MLTFFSSSLFAQCNLNDWNALKQIYASTNGSNWSNNTNWNLVTGNAPPANCDLGTMHGITLGTTGASNGRVVTIDLRSNNLVGIIPPEIGLLSELDEMQIYRNQLKGEIPAEIGNLSKLTIIGLDNNRLSGAIPTEIGNLNNLTILILNNNLLCGPVPEELGNLNNLTDLFLFNNQLSSCFDNNLSRLCNQLYYYDDITSGNSFTATWEDFCTNQAGTCNQVCENSRSLSGTDNINRTYKVNHTITSTATIDANIIYQAGSYVDLKDNFEVLSISNFEVNIQGCN